MTELFESIESPILEIVDQAVQRIAVDQLVPHPLNRPATGVKREQIDTGDRYQELADRVLSAYKAGEGNAFTLRATDLVIPTIKIALKEEMFTGEYFLPDKTNWFDKWLPIEFLSSAFKLWNVPIDPDITSWEISSGALLLHAADIGLLGGAKKKEYSVEFQEKSVSDNEVVGILESYEGTDCVYFLKAKSLGLIKIGFSGNVAKRVSSLQTSSPDDLLLMKIIKGGQKVEATLHQKFAKLRVRGEWFSPDKELVDFITEAK